MKKRMILVALLAMPLSSLLATCHSCEKPACETKPVVKSRCNMCNLGCSSCKKRTYNRDSEMMFDENNPELTPMYEQPIIEEYLEVPYGQQVVEETIGETPMYSQQVVKESLEIPYGSSGAAMLQDQRSGYSTTPMYSQQVVEETIGQEPMYSQQVVEESVEGTAAVTGLSPAQQHSALMNEVKSTSGRKPSQVAGAKKTAAPKKTTTAKSKKAATTKKPAKATPAKKTTGGKKAATNKTAAQKKRNYAKNTKNNKVTKTSNKVA